MCLGKVRVMAKKYSPATSQAIAEIMFLLTKDK